MFPENSLTNSTLVPGITLLVHTKGIGPRDHLRQPSSCECPSYVCRTFGVCSTTLTQPTSLVHPFRSLQNGRSNAQIVLSNSPARFYVNTSWQGKSFFLSLRTTFSLNVFFFFLIACHYFLAVMLVCLVPLLTQTLEKIKSTFFRALMTL